MSQPSGYVQIKGNPNMKGWVKSVSVMHKTAKVDFDNGVTRDVAWSNLEPAR